MSAAGGVGAIQPGISTGYYPVQPLCGGFKWTECNDNIIRLRQVAGIRKNIAKTLKSQLFPSFHFPRQ